MRNESEKVRANFIGFGNGLGEIEFLDLSLDFGGENLEEGLEVIRGSGGVDLDGGVGGSRE